MGAQKEMMQGWDFAASLMGADMAAQMSSSYVGRVEEAIRKLEDAINNNAYRNLDAGQLRGYIFEEWEAGTFNVNAAAAQVKDRATVLHSNAEGSADIHLESGKDYQLKSYRTAEESAKAQAKFNRETRQASYKNQERLVPEDQLPDAKATAHRLAQKNSQTRPDVAEAYAETEEKLTDRLQGEKGVTSDPSSLENLDNVAQESKDQTFSAEEHGITTANAIEVKYLMKQAAKAGCTSAAVTAALQLTPEIVKAFSYLIRNGELEEQQLRDLGKKGISAGADGFLRGSVASFLQVQCETGAFGAAFRGVHPTVLGTMTALVMQTVRNSFSVAAGEMSPQQMGSSFADTVVVSGQFLAGAQIAGAIGQALGIGLPVVGYMLGSLVGSVLCKMYSVGRNKLISFCTDTGFTCFGLVEQDYVLPENVLLELGIETAPVPRAPIERANVPTARTASAAIPAAGYDTVSFTVLRRGVIGVNRIGYVS